MSYHQLAFMETNLGSVLRYAPQHLINTIKEQSFRLGLL
jgi:hypothetical protein